MHVVHMKTEYGSTRGEVQSIPSTTMEEASNDLNYVGLELGRNVLLVIDGGLT